MRTPVLVAIGMLLFVAAFFGIIYGIVALSGGPGPDPTLPPKGCIQAHDEYHGGYVYAICDKFQPSPASTA